ncbi:MAG: response regulator [Synechocystis sp.]
MIKQLASPWDDATHPAVVVIEDSDEDFYTFRRIIEKIDIFENIYCPLLRFDDGDDALDYLLREREYAALTAPRPKLVLLDLNLPGTDGRDIIKGVRQEPRLRSLPIVVLTTSQSQQDIEICYASGANGYVLKRVGIEATQDTLQALVRYWFAVSVLPDPN